MALRGKISPDVPPMHHHRKPARAETLIERIYREETAYKMPHPIKRILLRKLTAKPKSR